MTRQPRLSLADLVGPAKLKTRAERVADLERGVQYVEEMTKRLLADLTVAERKVLQLRFPEKPPVLVWCQACGCSYESPWGRCVFYCERCDGRLSAREPE